MNLYEILLPEADNHGNSYEGMHIAFRAFVLSEAGGYTMAANALGAWRSSTGEVFHDVVTPYRVACDVGQWSAIMNKAAALFSDQQAIAWAKIGEMLLYRVAALDDGQIHRIT